MTTKTFTPGQRVRFVNPYEGQPDKVQYESAPFDIAFGTEAVVAEHSGPAHVNLTERVTGPNGSIQHGLHVDWLEAIEEPVALGRPTIDFGGDSRKTARQYAELIHSRKLDAEHRGVLADVINGYVVDAYALNAALTATLRLGLGRYKDAAGRKDFSRQVGYLAHIVQAVLENHADQLPAYEQGVRSRAIETLEGTVSALRTAGEDALRELTATTAKLTETEARYTRFQGDANDEVSRLLVIIEERTAQRDELQQIKESLDATVLYARALLAATDEVAAHQVAGFLDAHGLAFATEE